MFVPQITRGITATVMFLYMKYDYLLWEVLSIRNISETSQKLTSLPDQVAD